MQEHRPRRLRLGHGQFGRGLQAEEPEERDQVGGELAPGGLDPPGDVAQAFRPAGTAPQASQLGDLGAQVPVLLDRLGRGVLGQSAIAASPIEVMVNPLVNATFRRVFERDSRLDQAAARTAPSRRIRILSRYRQGICASVSPMTAACSEAPVLQS